MNPHDAGLPDPSGNPSPGSRGPQPVAGRIDPSRLEPVRELASPPPGLSAGPEFGTLLQALRRRWAAAVLLGGGLAVATAFVAWTLMAAKFTAFARVKITYKPGLTDTQGDSRSEYDLIKKTSISQIISRPTLWAALKREEMKAFNFSARFPDPTAAVTALEEDLKVDALDNSEIITLLYHNADPDFAVAVVKAISSVYLEEAQDSERKSRSVKVNQLEKMKSEASSELMGKKVALANEIKSKGANQNPTLVAVRRMDLTSSLRDIRTQVNSFRMEELKVRGERQALERKVKSLEKSTLSVHAIENALQAHPDYAKLRQSLRQVQRLVDAYVEHAKNYQQEAGYLSARKRARQLRQQVEDLREEVRARLKKESEGLKGELATALVELREREDSFRKLQKESEGEVVRVNGELQKLPATGMDADMEAQDAEIKRGETAVARIDEQLTKAKVEMQAPARATMAQEAELQKKDIKKQVLAIVGAPVFVFFGVCFTLAWVEYRQHRIRSVGEVSRGLGIRVVGAVPEMPNLERHLTGVTSGEEELEHHPVLESIDAIRTLLLRADHARTTRIIMVSSATTGEGKTTLAGHLAGSLARAGRRTLLIDGDLRRPSVHQLFELPMQPGFSEALLGEVEVADAVHETTHENLSVMPSGQWDREVLQSLAHDGLEGIFEKLQEEFDFLVIDSHPVLPATDSLLIGQRVDAVLLSVRREVSQMPRVYAAAQTLSNLGIRVLGAVVIGTDPEEVFTATALARPLAG
jgi:succinoglycan biosynthesis transport protein ExoP